MKVLVLGSTGMAGHLITLFLKQQGHNVTAYSRSSFSHCKNIIGNIFNTEELKKIIIDGNYDAIVTCLGILNDLADKNRSEAVFLNSYLPHFIADFLKESKTKLIQISTDCVFSGNTGPYDEDSFRDGIKFYDRSKALGEIIDEKNLTIRSSIIGPDMKQGGIGLFNWFMAQKGSVEGFCGAIWTGVTTLTLAKAIDQAVKQDLSGLYNLVNNRSISKFDLLTLINESFRKNEILITKSEFPVIDKSLRNNRSDFLFEVPPYEKMIDDMKDWVINNASLYPHYKIC